MAVSQDSPRKVPGQAEYGGYDHEFVGEVPEQFMCTICTKVLRDPHLTGCCGQHYCETCLTHWFKKHKSKTCPHCRENNLAHLQNKALKRQVNKLKVYCTRCKWGCEWEGELSDLQTHLDSNKGCGYVELECPNKCHMVRKLMRKDMDKHLKTECYLRRYKCKHCNHMDTYEAITGGRDNLGYRVCMVTHYDTCPMIPLTCPNRCGALGIRRKDMSNHRELCPLEPVQCPFQEAGCETKLAVRRDLEDHMVTQMQQHLLLTFQTVRMLRQENAELKQEVQALMAKST